MTRTLSPPPRNLNTLVMEFNSLCDQIDAAHKAEDWGLCEELCEQRRFKEVELDEMGLCFAQDGEDEENGVWDFEDRAPSEDWE